MKTLLVGLLITLGAMNSSLACTIMQDQFEVSMRNKLIASVASHRLSLPLYSTNIYSLNVKNFSADLIELPPAEDAIPCNFKRVASATIVLDAVTKIGKASSVNLKGGKNLVSVFAENSNDESVYNKSIRCLYNISVKYDERNEWQTEVEYLSMKCDFKSIK